MHIKLVLNHIILYLLIYFAGPDYQAEFGKLEAAGRTKDNTIQELMKRIEEQV